MRKFVLLLTLLGIYSLSYSQSTSWKGTSSNSWTTASNWTNGVPTSAMAALIGDASFTGAYFPTSGNGSTCKSLTIGGGTRAITLTVNKNLTVSGAILLNTNGTILQGKCTISLTGNWTNNGTYTYNNNSSNVSFKGTVQAITGVTTFRKLTINQGSSVTLNSNISTDGIFSVSGTINPNENPTNKITVNNSFIIGSAGNVKVTGSTFSANYSANPSTITAGGSVEYSAATAAQTVSNSFTYSVLKISGMGTRTLAGNIAISTGSSAYGSVYVNGGTIDLSTFTINRTTAGGTFNLANGTSLKVGGTSNFPTGYTATSLNLTSTVEYYAGAQTVASQTYGNLILSSSATGTIVKTLPSTAFTVAGNFVSSQGASTSLIYTAGSNITVNGTMTIGSGTAFNGSVANGATTYTHKMGSNLTNNGTIYGNNSIVNLNGSGSILGGSGTSTFNHLTITASNVTCAAAAISLTGSLSTSGSGTFTHTGGTLTMSGGNSITGASIILNNLTVSGSGTLSSVALTLAGNLAVGSGATYNCTSGTTSMTGSSKTISGAGSIQLNTLSASGSITATTSFVISGTLDVTGSFTASSGTASFTGTSLINGTANLNNIAINGTSLQLTSNTSLGIAGTFTITAGAFNVTSTVPNTVVYNGASGQDITGTTYHNLRFSGANTKTATGNIAVNADLTIGSGTTFAGSNYTHTIKGNWINSGSFAANTSNISFTGSDDVTVTGASTFSTLTINKANATNTVTLQNNISTATATMTKGYLRTGSNKITITNTRNGAGSIIGTIERNHSFTSGIDYAFESDQNVINFTSASNINSVTVTVKQATVTDFPFGAGINREYTISIPAGTYTSAKLRLHYEDAELNGNMENNLGLWRNNGSSWTSAGSTTASNTTANYVEQTNITAITNRWSLGTTTNVVTWNGSVNNDWNTAGNWTSVQGAPSLPPSGNDVVQIGTTAFTNQPTISTSASVKSILFGSLQSASLNLAAGGSLATQGNISGAWSATATHQLNVGDQALTVGGSLALSDGTTGHAIDLSIATGVINLSGSLTETGGANISFSGAGTLNIGGDFNYTSGTFTAGAGKVVYNGTNYQAVGSVTYNQLTINKTSGNATSGTGTTTAAGISILAGEFDFLNATVVTGDITMATGTTARNSTTLMVGGNWNNSGTYIPEGGSVTFNGNGTQTISATTFNNLVINKTSGNAKLTGNVTVNYTVTVNAGTLDLSTYKLERSSVGGTFTLANNTSLLAAGNNFPSNYITYTFGSSSNTTYYGTTAQTVAGIAYGNLTFSGNGIKTLAAAATVQGDITINAGASFDGSAYNINLNGNWTNNGTFIPSTGAVLLNGSGKTITGNTTFNKLTVYGGYTVAGSDITYNGALRILTGASYAAGSGLATLKGDLLNSGTLTSSGTTTFTGTTVQNISLINAITSTSTGIINFEGTVAPVFNSTTEPTFAVVNINNTAGISPSVNWNVYTDFKIGSGATFNGGGFTHTIYGSFTNNGTVSSDGIINFIPSSAQTVALGSSKFSSTGTVIFGGTGALTVTGTPAALENVIVANTAGATAGGNWNMTGTFTIQEDAVFNAGSYSHTVGGDLEANGTLNGGTSTFTMTSSAPGELYGSDNAQFYNLTIAASALIEVAADVNITHDLTNNNTTADNLALDASGARVSFTGSTSSNITGAATSFQLNLLGVNKTGGASVTLGKKISFVNDVEIIAGTFDIGSLLLAQDVTAGASNTLTINNGGTLKIGGTNTVPAFTNYSLDSLSTVEFAGSTQNIPNTLSYGNLTISFDGTKTASGALTLAKNFTLSAGTFNGAGFTHSLGGNLTISSGTTLNNAPTFILKGTNSQNINSALPLTNLTLNNATGNLSLSNHLTINAALTFTAGKLGIGNYNLIINDTGSIVTPTSAKYVVTAGSGKLKQRVVNNATEKLFPVGTATDYLPATLSLSASSTTDFLGVRVANAAYVDGGSGIVKYSGAVTATWELSEDVLRGSDATLKVQWPASLEQSGFICANARLAHYENATWDYGSTSSTTIAGAGPFTATRSGITSFSPFSVRMNSLVLPVTWVNVSAMRVGENNQVNWTTTNAVNNDFFEVQSSTDGIHFNAIGKVATNTTHNYGFRHGNVSTPLTYYRIKQTDLDGSFSYSAIVKVSVGGIEKAVTITPNPVQNTATISMNAANASLLKFTMTDAAGHLIKQMSFAAQAGINQIPIDLSGQPSGVYFLRMVDEAGKLQTVRFVKQ